MPSQRFHSSFCLLQISLRRDIIKTDSVTLYYLYDDSGSPIGMQYRTPSYAEGVWDTYYFDKNLQGDIVAVYDQSGTKLVSYRYDAWGGFWTTAHNGGASTPAYKNPFRYRGYYFDTDVWFYYLNARYYDPIVKRFINADSALYHSILGYNMFAYCDNNPVNYVDYNGESAEAVIEISKAVIAYGWTFALAEPTIFGEVIYGIAAIGALSVICLVSLSASEADNSVNDAPQSITELNEEVETSSTTISKAKESESKDTKKREQNKGKKVAPRIKSNNKKSARQRAFLKGGKQSPIHHPNGKFGPHFHPNNPKFSHWHYYYIIVFTVGQLKGEQ